MKVLIIGRGGREHAIAWKVAQSPLTTQIFIAPGNEGMRNISSVPVELVPIDENDTAALLQFAQAQKIDLTIVGPEAALMNGISNEFEAAGLRIFAPTKEAINKASSLRYFESMLF